MAMNSKRLHPLTELASAREDEALQRLAERQGHLAAQEARLLELTRYLEDYQRDSGAQARVTLAANRHAFVARLREALACQERVVGAARLACDSERAHWLAQQRDVKVLEQLALSYRKQENHRHERREQGEMDELATRRALSLENSW